MFEKKENNVSAEMVNDLLVTLRNKGLDKLKVSELKNVVTFIRVVQSCLNSINQSNEEVQIMLDLNEISELLGQANIALMCVNSI